MHVPFLLNCQMNQTELDLHQSSYITRVKYDSARGWADLSPTLGPLLYWQLCGWGIKAFSSSQSHANWNLQDARPEGHWTDSTSLIQRKGGQGKRKKHLQTDGWHSLVQSQSHRAHQGEQAQALLWYHSSSFTNSKLKSFTFNLIALAGSGERKCLREQIKLPNMIWAMTAY